MFGRLAPRFDHRIECGAFSHSGLVRPENEDAWHADRERGLFVLADGMGGHAAGEVASRLVVATVRDALHEDAAERALRAYASGPSPQTQQRVFERIEAAAEKARVAVREAAVRRPEQAGMGSTLDIVMLVRDRAFVVHVGDSRVYLVRSAATIQVTDDHDVRAQMGAKVSVPPRTRTAVPNRLLNAIGVGENLICDRISFPVEAGDRIVLCTDGVHQTVVDENRLDPRARDPRAAAHSLIEGALAAGGRDNATAIVVDVREVIVPRKNVPPPSRDRQLLLGCPLFAKVPPERVTRVLAAGVEVDLPEGRIRRVVAHDRAAYVVLEGEVRRSDGASLGPGAVLYPESLVHMRRTPTHTAVSRVRALRLRANDLDEVCRRDPLLAADVYRELARCLAGEAAD